MIDLSRFNLTTPELKPGTEDTAMSYSPGEFPQNDFFYQTPEGFVVHAPTKAAGTTANSDRARCEVRETTEQGKAVNFTLDQYQDSFLQAAVTVLQAPEEGRTTIGQIHVKNSTRPMLKLFHDGNQLIASFREKFSQKDPINTVLRNDVPVLTRFSYSIHVTKSGKLQITTAVGDAKSSVVFDIDDTWRPRELYFKAGTYIQEDATEDTKPDEGSTILFDKLSIRHE